MNQTARKFILLAIVLVTVVSLTGRPAAAQGKVKILWFVGLGSGTNEQQQAVQKEVVADFNASQDKIELTIQVGASYGVSMDTITTLIASGNAPDIAGPVGVSGSNALEDQWMDLKPLIDKNKVDLTQFDPSLLDMYKLLNGGFSAIPFAVFPSIMYYNPALFDEAGLKYPPTKVGDKYELDDKQVDWNYDTVAQIAKLLTVDKNGNDATSDQFDPKNTVQYGLNFQWALMRLILTDLQPARFYDAATNKIKLSDDWRKAIQWYWDGLWKDHFIVNATADASTLYNGNAFDSTHLAMAITPLWYTCCLQDTAGKFKWQIGVVPASLDGKTHVAVDADTFRILKSTKHPDEAFTVLQYILDQAVPKLAPTYGAFPARPKYQQTWIETQNKVYTQGVNWQVALDSLKYSNPIDLHHESNIPHYNQVADRFASFKSLIEGGSGDKMDVKAETDKLEKDLQSIVEGTFPTSTPVPTAAPAK